MTTETIPETTVPLEPTTRERTARDVLLGAARYIEEMGWTQGGIGGAHTGDGYMQACAANAIYRVGGGGPLAFKTQDRFSDYLGVPPLSGIWSWNDTPGRTEAEVLAALRAAADTAP